MRQLLSILVSCATFISCDESGFKKEKFLRLTKQKFLHVDSTLINGQKVFAYCDTSDFFFVLNNVGDTLFSQSQLLSKFEFVDFNLDGRNDIYINWLSGAPDTKTLLLYDTSQKNFRLIEDFENYPAPKRILNTNLFYSYSKSGCADLNWTSSLFQIENFIIKNLGYIYTYGCDKNHDYSGVNIYKFSRNNKEILLEKRDISILDNYKDYKWGFIDKYWKDNYHLFKK